MELERALRRPPARLAPERKPFMNIVTIARPLQRGTRR